MRLSRFIFLFYVQRFFFDFVFIYAVEKLFFVSKGLDLAEISILLFLWSVMSALLEVPSGAIADRWSRRKMLIVSGFSFVLCYVIWIGSSSFIGLLVGFFFRTIGGTFASGTLQAYVYDYLHRHGKEAEFERIWGRGNSLRIIGIGVAIAAGGFLSTISYEVTLILSAVSVSLISLIAFIWPEVPIAKSTEETQYWQFIRQASWYVFTHPLIMQAVLYLFFVPTILGELEEYNDIFLNFNGFSNAMIGLVIASVSIFQAFGSSVAFRFKDSPWVMMNGCVVVVAACLLIMGLFQHMMVALVLPILGLVYGFTDILIEGVIQQNTESEQRATVSSASRLVMYLAPGYLVFGFLATQYGIQVGYLVLAGFVLSYFVVSPLILAFMKGR
jgi:MFS family permease